MPDQSSKNDTEPLSGSGGGRAFEQGRDGLAVEAARARGTAARRRAQTDKLRAEANAIYTRARARTVDRDRARSERRATAEPRLPHGDGRIALILDEDPELAGRLPEQHRRPATRLLYASVLRAGRGSWDPPRLDPATTYGLLLLDGLIGQRVRVANATAMEILGPGDVIRPWDELPLADTLALPADWEIFQPARLAVLDKRITALIARFPQLSVALSGRLLRRNQRLSYLLAVSHLSRLEDRLLATLWYFAVSWGRVSRGGVAIPISLTHQTLGEIAGAQRPSVSIAMASLRDRRLLTREDDGTYVLCGDTPTWQRPPFGHLLGTDGARSR